MKEFMEYLPFIIPIMIVEFALMIIALVHLLKHKKFRFGNQLMWTLIVVLLQIIGPILYFTVGRGEE